MKKHPLKPQTKTLRPSEILWLSDQFTQIDNANALILSRIKDVDQKVMLILAKLKRIENEIIPKAANLGITFGEPTPKNVVKNQKGK
jgi:hypothetical protein